MAVPIIMPQVAQNIDSALIVEWHVKENDYVKKGDILLLVETDKAVFEVESEESGVILKILYEYSNVKKKIVGEPQTSSADSQRFKRVGCNPPHSEDSGKII